MNTNMHADKTEAGRTNDGGGRRRSLWKSPAIITALILLILLLCNHFVDGWNWPLRAFVMVGALIFGIGFTYELITRNRHAIAYRATVGIAFTAGFLIVWGNFVQMAAVTPAAAMYFGVPIVGLIGAAVARLRPNGMARALFRPKPQQGRNGSEIESDQRQPPAVGFAQQHVVRDAQELTT